MPRGVVEGDVTGAVIGVVIVHGAAPGAKRGERIFLKKTRRK